MSNPVAPVKSRKYSYNYRKQVCKYGAFICPECEGYGSLTEGPTQWDYHEYECNHCDGTGINVSEMNWNFKRIKRYRINHRAIAA